MPLSPTFRLYTYHILNDGLLTSLLLLPPFFVHEFSLSLTQVGILGGAANILQIAFGLPAGLLAARIGGFPVLGLSLLLSSLGFFATTWAHSYSLLIASFFIAGIGLALFHPVAFSLVAQTSTAGNRGSRMGDFTAVGDIGRITLASATPFLITLIGWRPASLAIGSIGLLTLLIIRPRRAYALPPAPASAHAPLGLRSLATHPRFLLAVITGALDNFASVSLFIFLPFLLLLRGVDPATLGAYAAVFFVGNFVGKSGIGRALDRFGVLRTFAVSELLMAGCIVFLALARAPLLIIIAAALLGVFTKGTAPAVQTLIANTVTHPKDLEHAFGLSSVLAGIALTAAPPFFGALSDAYGIVASFYGMAGAAIFAIIPAVILSLLRRRAPIAPAA